MGQGEVLCLCGFLGVFFCICDCVWGYREVCSGCICELLNAGSGVYILL